MISEEIYTDTISLANSDAECSSKVFERFEYATMESTSPQISIPSYVERYSNLVIFTFLFIYFAIYTRRIIEGITRSFSSMFNLKKLKNIDWELTLRGNRNTSFIFSTFLFIFILCYHCSTIDKFDKYYTWELFLIAILGWGFYLLIKLLISIILDYVNDTSIFREINRFFRNYIIIATISSSLIAIILYLLPITVYLFVNVWIIVCFVISYIAYFVMIYNLFKENKFPILFYILYICALEILPIVLLGKLITSL